MRLSRLQIWGSFFGEFDYFLFFKLESKVIEKHIRMAHGNGIGAISLETEEDIRKWREERRKNYPTRAKVNEKKEGLYLQ